MEVTLVPCQAPYVAPFRALYEEAFPPGERKEFGYLLTRQSEGIYDLWAVLDSANQFVGLVGAVLYDSYVLLDYLAVCPDRRGRGIGHRTLAALRRHYPDRRLFLEIETPDPRAANAEQRLRRLAFYSDAGLVRTGVHAHIYGEDMELLAYPEDAAAITFSLYRDMLSATFPPDMQPLP